MSFSIIRIHAAALDQFICYCRAQLPHEACGLFFGAAEDRIASDVESSVLITQFVPIPNTAPSSPERRYQMRPDSLIQALYQWGSDPSARLAGIAHSHPHAPAIPSKADINTMWSIEDISHWIVSLADLEHPDVKVYRFLQGPSQNQTAIPLPFSIHEQQKDPGTT